MKTFVMAGVLSLAGVLASSALAQPAPTVGYIPVTESDAASRRSHFGRVEAIRAIDVRNRVNGVLAHWHVAEGEQVEAGQLLAEIDQGVYRARVRAARAEVLRTAAGLELALLEQKRLASLHEKRAVSQAELDVAIAVRRQAEAALEAAEAALELREIDLDYTRISAPFSGKISSFAVDQGGYVEANTVLTDLVQLDPVRVTYAVSERELIDYRRQALARRSDQPAPAVERSLRLADGSTYAYPGVLRYVDNQLTAETATLSLHLEFPNPDALLSPGQFVEISTRRGRERSLPAVPAASILRDSEGDYVLLLDADDTVIRRNIEVVGKTATLALLREGTLLAGERVIVQGLSKAQIGSQVSAEPLGGDER
ncbi:MAG: efflux RND transporter periplasmic adaptor subunit [Halioglobus sp.]|nr:efflux RND transporter periplasmic adaptor subunit [Halioglobus sp.]